MRKMELNATWHFIAVVLLPLCWKGYPTSEALPSLPELCPYTNFCRHQANRTLDDPGLQSCCLPCSCNEDCGIVNKCCPDVTHDSVPTNAYPCRYQDEIYASYLKINNWEDVAHHSYHVIDGCPGEAFDNPELSVNVAHCYNASELQDLVFVTGAVSGNTYLNKHCAICNIETVYTEWALYLVESNLLTMNMSFEERDRRILSRGGVVSVPPTQEIAMNAFCLIPIYQTCNVTGDWDIFDQEIEQKCHELAHGYISETSYRRKQYANVYCFMCNEPKGTPVTPECNRIAFGATEVQKGVLSQPFSALLTAKPPIVQEEQSCPTREVLDPFRLECTALFCPIGTLPQGGVCASIVEDMEGYKVSLALQIELDSNIDPVAINYDDFADDLLRLFQRKVNRGNIRCGICSLDLLDSYTRGTMYSLSTFLTTELCTASDLLRGLYILFPTQSVSKRLPKTKTTPIFLTVDSETVDQNDRDLLFTRIHENCFHGSAAAEITFNPIENIYCPSIHLKHNDMRVFADHGDVVSMIMSNSVDIGNGSVRVCIEDYISVLKRTHLISGRSQRHAPNMCIGILIVLAKMFD